MHDLFNITDSILDYLGLSVTDTFGKTSKVLAEDLIYCLIATSTIKEAAYLLEVSEDSLEHLLHRHFKSFTEKSSKTKWGIHLLSLVGIKRCIKCEEIYPFSSFSYSKQKYCEVNSMCRECDNKRSKQYRDLNIEVCRLRSNNHYSANKADYLARNAARRALKLNATPTWADLEKIKEIYRTCPEGYHVDHIIPLQGELVCGLHVENNLQHLPALENMQKHNKFTGE